ncbi:MAG: metal-sulfur cluster assembly factor [Synergistetes bacterium]|nr:metal-sulfur cluster assembly factor [Synergistota bacterium]
MVNKEQVLEALKNVYDPEIPIDIVNLGLIYGVDVNEDAGVVHVRMTLTTPGCPLTNLILADVKNTVKGLEGVKDVELELVFDPPWSPDMISEDAKKHLGF